MRISVIIPTRNRHLEVKRLLESLANQSRLPDEVILVDASDDGSYTQTLPNSVTAFPLAIIYSEPSVCKQRNTGIHAAVGDWIFLCDDDIVPRQDYLKKLEEYILQTGCGAVCGLLLQEEREDNWVHHYPVKNFFELVYRFVFQLSLWGDLEEIKAPFFLMWLKKFLLSYYQRKGNTISRAGWPVITNWSGPAFQARVFSLGASLVKREWLLNSLYDETLDPSGMGDNYGVALDFPGDFPIHVIKSTSARHHRSDTNRLDHGLAYYRRALALHYFIKRKRGIATTAFFLWSLFGNFLLAIGKLNCRMAFANLKVLALVLVNRNPYWLGFVDGRKRISPEL